MKKLFLILMLVSLYSCSSDDSGNNIDGSSQNEVLINGNSYEFNNAYLLRFTSTFEDETDYTFAIVLCKGEILDFSYDFENTTTNIQLSNNFEHWLIINTNPHGSSSSFSARTYTMAGNELISVSMANDFIVQNNEIQSYSTVFNTSDVVSEQANVTVNRFNNGTYNINFTSATLLGQVIANYTGELTFFEQ